MPTYSSETLIKSQEPFSFSYHRLAYAAEYKKVEVKFIVSTNLSNETIKVKRFIFNEFNEFAC